MPRRRLELKRHWRAFFLGLCAIAVAGLVILVVVPRLAGLFLLALYCIPSNSVFPIPHEPGVLYFAKFYDPLGIAIAATVASVVVSFADYAIVEAAMRHPRMNRAVNAGLFRWAVKWMKRWPFIIVFLFSLVPLPISVIRVLAPASGYPIGRYAVAQILGRMPRFYALAWLGQAVEFPTWLLIVMFVALFALFWYSGRSSEEDTTEDVSPVPPEPPSHATA